MVPKFALSNCVTVGSASSAASSSVAAVLLILVTDHCKIKEIPDERPHDPTCEHGRETYGGTDEDFDGSFDVEGGCGMDLVLTWVVFVRPDRFPTHNHILCVFIFVRPEVCRG